MATGLYSRPLMSSNFSVHSIDARDLSATDGLLLLVTRSLDKLTAGHWDGARDIPWAELVPLDAELERAVCQLMTFLAENEFSALYVPAKWIARIHPHFAETVLFLSTQVRDEARHIEVFVKRALANGGGLQFSSASTQASLKSLLDQEDFISIGFPDREATDLSELHTPNFM